ncbi:hypothetical protein AB0B57_23225 [Micromonospora sp. NPDC049101]|uniref:hypothetical protein n=1 Tax=Micromonospora sp. NPDC049101 TaxID=3155032 RepID=UPI0033F23C8C
MRRRLAMLGLCLLMLGVSTQVIAPAAVAAPTSALRAPGETGKYYVVGPPVDGQREYLFAIAAKTLGNGNRSPEIFALNEGRLQPDGRRLTDATSLQPGWILVLPRDATGPGVQIGALPAPTPAPTAVSPSPPSTASTASADPPAPSTVTLPHLSVLWSATGLRVALIALAVLLLLWAHVALRARHRPARGGAAPASSPVPPVPTTTPPDPRPAPVTAPPAEQPPPPAPAKPTLVLPPPVAAEPPTRPLVAVTTKPPAPPPAAVAVEPPAPPPAAVTIGTPAPPPVAVPLPRAVDRTPARAVPDVRAAGLLPLARPNPFATLLTDLTCGPDRATVRLVGARPARWGSPYGWLTGGQRPPPSSAPLVLGDRDGHRLWIDLAVAPDVLTIGGDLAACRRHALALLNQFDADTDVVLVGDVLGDAAPEGCRRVDAVAEVAAEEPSTRVRVVVCAGPDAVARWGPFRALSHSPHRTVPIVVGAGPAARWSMRLDPPVAAQTAR